MTEIKVQGHDSNSLQTPPLGHASELNKVDRAVIVSVVAVGFVGSVILYFLRVPSILTSVFLSAGVASLVYHFLGGIDPTKTSFNVGAFRVVGSLAALVGVALLVNQYLTLQQSVRLVEKDLLGQWKWVYGRGGWEGFLNFKQDSSGRLIFSGDVDQYTDPSGCNPRLKLTNGKANLVDGRVLHLEADALDCRYKDVSFHLNSDEPLIMLPAFRGQLLPDAKANGIFGIMIYKHQGP
jgi:hypothetical protein